MTKTVYSLLTPELAGEMSFACRAMLSKKRRELSKLEASAPNDEHLPSIRARVKRLEQSLSWLDPYRSAP